jgi:hypothetical protein
MAEDRFSIIATLLERFLKMTETCRFFGWKVIFLTITGFQGITRRDPAQRF